ncbi:MAG: glycosyltransferase [Bacteroidales bacterium]|nr:glycosyltransferase [Bacteroidales bacterium]MBN2820701.1 glycosyltransferase [Bacteroidales bacterium]
MKAVLINSLQHGGAERIALNIFLSLSSQGEDILLIVLKKSVEQYQVDSPNIIYLSVNSYLDRGLSVKKILVYPKLLLKFIKLIKEKEIKVVQSHLFTSSILNVLARILGGKQEVQIVNHMLVSYEKSAGIVGKLKIASLRFTYKRANKLISISQKMKMDIDKLILKDKKVEHIVIPNPHDIEGIVAKSKEGCNDFNFNPEKKYIVSAGRLVDRKKTDMLLRAFSIVKQRNQQMELIVLGDGENIVNLKNLARELKISDAVHFLGFSSNPFKYISRSDLFVLSSESEGLPNAVIEALICKVPILSTDCPTGPREILAPESDYNLQLTDKYEIAEYGMLVPVNNAEILAEAIVYFFENSEELKLKTEHGFLYAQKFASEIIIKQYKHILS